jgi:hypothetical protein
LGSTLRNLGTEVSFQDTDQSDPLPRTLDVGSLLGVCVKSQDIFGEDSFLPSHYKLLSIDFTANLKAYIDKLREDDDEMRLAIEIKKAERRNQGKPVVSDEELENEINRERGIGIHALEWEHLEKGVGVEFGLMEVIAFRMGYGDDPYIEYDALVDHLSFGVSLRLPVSIFLVLVGLGGRDSFFHRIYRDTPRQVFGQIDVTVRRPSGPSGKRLLVWGVNIGI